MTEQDPDQPAEEFHRDRREHPGKLERLDDDQLARLAEEERVEAGLDDYDPDEVPPATDEPPTPDVTQSDDTRRPAPRSAASTTRASWKSRASGPASRRRATTGEALMTSPPEHLNNHHRDTLREIFRHPAGHNIEWHSVVSLLDAVGTVTTHHDGKVTVTVGAQSVVLTPPKGKDIDTRTVTDLRGMLAAAGYSGG